MSLSSWKHFMSAALVAGVGLVLAGSAPAQTADAAIKWGAAPPFFPAGARFAVLQGDPSQAGPYTVRLSMPPGYLIRPHTHPTDEHVTVISGTLTLGMGDSVKLLRAKRHGTGAFVTAPANMSHFALARARTVVQVHGMGPFAITYVNPKDDPRNAKPAP
jgi:quercetin dioxygenase-like cupin family protein